MTIVSTIFLVFKITGYIAESTDHEDCDKFLGAFTGYNSASICASKYISDDPKYKECLGHDNSPGGVEVYAMGDGGAIKISIFTARLPIERYQLMDTTVYIVFKVSFFSSIYKKHDERFLGVYLQYAHALECAKKYGAGNREILGGENSPGGIEIYSKEIKGGTVSERIAIYASRPDHLLCWGAQ